MNKRDWHPVRHNFNSNYMHLLLIVAFAPELPGGQESSFWGWYHDGRGSGLVVQRLESFMTQLGAWGCPGAQSRGRCGQHITALAAQIPLDPARLQYNCPTGPI